MRPRGRGRAGVAPIAVTAAVIDINVVHETIHCYHGVGAREFEDDVARLSTIAWRVRIMSVVRTMPMRLWSMMIWSTTVAGSRAKGPHLLERWAY